jgi:antitoxin component of MazEF toxin-antitoxin module
MTEIEAITRKWGNSLGITIPQEIVEEEHLHENQKIIVEINPAQNLASLRGLVKFSKSAQQLKEEMRAGWK